MRRVGGLVALAACHGGNPWDEVGPARPGQVRVELGAPAGLEVTEAAASLDRIDVDRCAARPSRTLLGGTWWVVPPMALSVEGGPWCALDLTWSGPLEVAGDGFGAELELPALSLVVDGHLQVDGDAFVLRLGDAGWLRSDDLVDGFLGPGDARHDAVVEGLVRTAALFRDDDDGVLTSDELAEGALTVE